VDGFKEYNDACGHEHGDRALAEIGEILRAALRGSDIAFRFGGRLLAVGLPGLDREAAVAVAGHIQERLRRHRFQGPSGERDRTLTASVGAVGYAAGARLPGADDLFKVLLGHLHRAEAEGSDRIFAAEA
jgi:diguanylate cyclase (GGDEF)-like protein